MKGYKETLAEGKSPPPFPLLKDSGRIYHHASAGREKKKKKPHQGNSRKRAVLRPTVTCRINQVHALPAGIFIPSICTTIAILLHYQPFDLLNGLQPASLILDMNQIEANFT